MHWKCKNRRGGKQHGIRCSTCHFFYDLLETHGAELGVQKFNLMTGIQQGSTDAQESQRRKAFSWQSASDGLVGWVDQ